MPTTRGLAMILFLGVVHGTSSAAEVPPPLAPCTSEIARHCPEITPGEGRILDCLRTHDADLSAECRALVARARSVPGRGRKPDLSLGPQVLLACQADLATHCAGVQAGNGRLRACLQAHASVLAPPCTRALAAHAQKPPDGRDPGAGVNDDPGARK